MALNKLTDPQKQFIKKLQAGQRATGYVKSFKDFGAFVSIGPVNGLLHNKNIQWCRTEDPEQVLRKGQKIEVIILDVDYEKFRVSLGLKQLQPDPWDTFSSNFSEGDKIAGTITQLRPFGAIMEIVPGVDALLHNNEIEEENSDQDQKTILKTDDVYEVEIIEMNRELKRLKVRLS